jgi:hypothetical protein
MIVGAYRDTPLLFETFGRELRICQQRAWGRDALMTGGMKLAAIGIIWIAFTVIMTSGSSPVSNADGSSAVWLTLALALAAGGSTLAIAVGGDRSQPAEQRVEKAKRTRSRVGRMMDSLSDDEVAELRARLMADDDEVVPLEQLMAEREERRSSR